MVANAYYNGEFSLKENIKISLSDRAVFFGDAVYDMMIGSNGKIYQASEHLSRLFFGASALGIKHNLTEDKVYDKISKVIELSGLKSYSIYIQLSRSAKERNHSAFGLKDYNLLIYVDKYNLPEEPEKIKLCTAEDKRYYFCNVKTINLLPAVLAATKADELGFEETIFHRGKYVTECSHSNVLIMKNNVIYTHPLCNLILPGITRGKLLSVARGLGIKIIEEPFTISDLYNADDVIITSTTKLLRTASEIDGIRNFGIEKATTARLFYELKRKILE